MPKDAQEIIERVEGIDGFYGASSTERFPTEIAIKEQIETFKAIRLPQKIPLGEPAYENYRFEVCGPGAESHGSHKH